MAGARRGAIRGARRCRSTRCTWARGGASDGTALARLRRAGRRARSPTRVDMGFTHIELMPITEHPLDGSWGYQPIGLFAPTSRFGEPAGFARFVDRCHARRARRDPRLGAGAFPDRPARPRALRRHRALRARRSARGLPPGLEHRDLQLRAQRGASTTSSPTRSSGSSAITSTACASTRWRRCSTSTTRASRASGCPNRYGGNENLEAIAFLRKLNETVYARASRRVTIAEESTGWPGVSRPTYTGGLGFGFKWNMGWMHDTLAYMRRATRCTASGTTTR